MTPGLYRLSLYHCIIVRTLIYQGTRAKMEILTGSDFLKETIGILWGWMDCMGTKVLHQAPPG